MKTYYVYKVIDKITNEFYIGSRGYNGNIHNDPYLGSYAVWKPDISRLVKNIIKSGFDSLSSAILYEREIIIKEIKNPLNRNFAIPHPKLSRDNLITGKYLNGKHVSVYCQDPLFLSGEIVGITKGLVLVEKDNKRFYVSVKDPLYISGELKHANCGKIIGKNHPNYGKKWVNDGEKQYLVDKNIHDLNDGTLQKGKTTSSAHSNSVWITNDNNQSLRISKNDLNSYINTGWKLGRKHGLCKKTMWVNNSIINKKVSNNELQEWIDKGWKRGQRT